MSHHRTAHRLGHLILNALRGQGGQGITPTTGRKTDPSAGLSEEDIALLQLILSGGQPIGRAPIQGR